MGKMQCNPSIMLKNCFKESKRKWVIDYSFWATRYGVASNENVSLFIQAMLLTIF